MPVMSSTLQEHLLLKSHPNKRNKLLVGVLISPGKRGKEQRLLMNTCDTILCVSVCVCTHVLCLQVSMASAMGSWCVTVAPLMYCVILPATSN